MKKKWYNTQKKFFFISIAVVIFFLTLYFLNTSTLGNVIFDQSIATSPLHSLIDSFKELFLEKNIPHQLLPISSPSHPPESQTEIGVFDTDATLSESSTPFAPEEFFVKVKADAKSKIKSSPHPKDTGIESFDKLNEKHGVKTFEQIGTEGKNTKKDTAFFQWYKVSLSEDKNPKKMINKQSPKFISLKEAMEDYRNDANIETIELNYEVEVILEPNDPYYSSSGSWGQAYDDLWGIKKINAAGAWDQTTGSDTIIVAGIDTGVDRNHPDITTNMWMNPNEIAGNNIDDDQNGYVDDIQGWDWVNNDNDPMDEHGHGTHTVGTIAATGNNGIGVVGVNWKSKIMALRFLDARGSGSIENAVKALQYAADNGARISSNSWGCACNSQVQDDAVKYEHDRGMIMVAAAGNSNADAISFSPAAADYAVTVSASTSSDTKASFSNWGEKIDVTAPGVDILSIRASINPMCTADRTVGTDYCHVSGTSMAAPHVAGLAALLLSVNPSLTNEEVRQLLRQGSDDLGTAGKDRDFGYGRINAVKTIALANTHPLTPVITSPTSRTTISGQSISITGSVGGPNFANYKVEIGKGRTPLSWTVVTTSTTQPTTDSVLATINSSQLSEGTNIIRLTATDTTGKIYQFQVHDVLVKNFDVALLIPQSLSSGFIDIVGTATTKNDVPFQDFIVDWSDGVSWSTNGITLVNNGLRPIVNGKLGTWDTTNLVDGKKYTLRLTVRSTLDINKSVNSNVTVDKSLLPGWPKIFPYNCHFCFNYLADLDGDGKKEIIVPTRDEKIYVFRKDGTDFTGFPVPVTLNIGWKGDWPMNIDDLDGDGTKEIITVASDNKLYIITYNGKFYTGWTPPVVSANSSSAPAIADIDNNGVKDIIILNYKKFVDRTEVVVNAYQLDGSQLLGFPKTNTLPGQLYPTKYFGAPNIIDMDHDGKSEIAWTYSTKIFLFDEKGNLLPGWPFTAPVYKNFTLLFDSAAASGDVKGDGNLVLFAGAVGNGCFGYGCPTQLYALNKDGSQLSGWPKTDTDGINVPWYNAAIPSLVDLDRNGKDEVIVGYSDLTIFDEIGKKNLLNPPEGINTQPALVDVDGDGQIEMITTSIDTVMVIKQDGTSFITYWKKMASSPESGKSSSSFPWLWGPVAVADIDNNGKMEVMATSTYTNISGYTIVDLWEIPSATSTAYEWPMLGHDPARTSRVVLNPSPPSIPDTTPPTVSITSPSNDTSVSGTITISASASDNVGMAKVELYIDGLLKSTDTASPFNFVWDSTTVGNGFHTILVKAYDLAGNIGTSTTVSVTVNNNQGDTTPPTVSITAPTNGTTVLGMVFVTSTASDNVGVTKVELYVDGTLQNTDTSSPYSFVWNSSMVANGLHTFVANAYDAAGNIGTSATISVNVNNPLSDTILPTVSVISPSNESIVSGTIIMTASASDNVGVTQVGFYVDGALQSTDTTSPYSYIWNSTSVTNGVHTLIAKAYDAVGNVGISSTISVNVSNVPVLPPADTTPPTVSITSPVNGTKVTRKSTLLISASASDNIGINYVGFYIKGNLYSTDTSSPYTATWKVPVKPGTTYQLTAKAYDAAGYVTTSMPVTITT